MLKSFQFHLLLPQESREKGGRKREKERSDPDNQLQLFLAVSKNAVEICDMRFTILSLSFADVRNDESLSASKRE